MSLCPKSIHCFRGEGHSGACRDQGTTADGATLDSMNLRLVLRDGVETLVLRCPGCGRWGDVDDDQLHGRVSLHAAPAPGVANEGDA